MKQNASHLEDIKEIRKLMEKSSKFLSLSGLSGVSAGAFALLGALAAFLYSRKNQINLSEYIQKSDLNLDDPVLTFLILLSAGTLILAILSGFYFSLKKAKQIQINFWNSAAIRMLSHLFIPIITGGLVMLILFFRNELYLIPALSLIFYGLGLINAGKFSGPDINFLGLIQIILGLSALVFPGNSLIFWTTGFGFLHVIYGIYLYLKYDRT